MYHEFVPARHRIRDVGVGDSCLAKIPQVTPNSGSHLWVANPASLYVCHSEFAGGTFRSHLGPQNSVEFLITLCVSADYGDLASETSYRAICTLAFPGPHSGEPQTEISHSLSENLKLRKALHVRHGAAVIIIVLRSFWVVGRSGSNPYWATVGVCAWQQYISTTRESLAAARTPRLAMLPR